MKRPRRSRDIRRSCIEISHRGLVKRTYRELLSRGLSHSHRGLVGSSCEEISNKGLGKRFRVSRTSGDLVEGPLIYKSCQVESSCREISFGFPTRRSRDIWRSCLEMLC